MDISELRQEIVKLKSNIDTKIQDNYMNSFPSDQRSRIETAILQSSEPISINQKEETTALGIRGIWANREEVINWKGPLPISQYKLNEDPNPEVVYKKLSEPLQYTQDVSIRYLKPPIIVPGDLIIKKENIYAKNLPPPQIIREQHPRAITPEPVYLREKPPVPPEVIPRQVITVPSDQPPPERKVIIERMAQMPPKPPPIIIEKWLPYEKQKRNVITLPDEGIEKQKNLVIQWELNTPTPSIKRNVKYVGVITTDPNEYLKKFGKDLKDPSEIKDYENHEDIAKRFYSYESNKKDDNSEIAALKNEIEKLKSVQSDILRRNSNNHENFESYRFL